jgi:DNA-directed RNA polymerase specialized sigma24 family protein
VKYAFLDYDSEENRQKRQHRRKLREDWKAFAKSIQSADPNKKMLMREARREAVAIIEEAARTHEDFEKVLMMWNDMEMVEKWRLDKHEHKFTEALPDDPKCLEYEVGADQTIIPQPLNHTYWRQLLGGSFLDVIYDCPHELHETTTSRPVRDLVMKLDENQKEILYYRAIRLWTPQKIAALRGQTDRNIRKVYNNMIDKIRRKLYERLHPRYDAREPLTHTQREFIRNYRQGG